MADTHAQNAVPARAWEFDSPPAHSFLQAGRCPADPHKVSTSGSIPGPATATAGYANSGKAAMSRGSVTLWVRLPPRLLVIGPVVQRPRRLSHMQETMVRVHAGSLLDCRIGLEVLGPHTTLVSVEDRVRSPAGPLESIVGVHVPRGRGCLASSLRWVQLPSSPLTMGPIVQREDTSLACWRSRFESG